MSGLAVDWIVRPVIYLAVVAAAASTGRPRWLVLAVAGLAGLLAWDVYRIWRLSA